MVRDCVQCKKRFARGGAEGGRTLQPRAFLCHPGAAHLHPRCPPASSWLLAWYPRRWVLESGERSSRQPQLPPESSTEPAGDGRKPSLAVGRVLCCSLSNPPSAYLRPPFHLAQPAPQTLPACFPGSFSLIQSSHSTMPLTGPQTPLTVQGSEFPPRDHV